MVIVLVPEKMDGSLCDHVLSFDYFYARATSFPFMWLHFPLHILSFNYFYMWLLCIFHERLVMLVRCDFKSASLVYAVDMYLFYVWPNFLPLSFETLQVFFLSNI